MKLWDKACSRHIVPVKNNEKNKKNKRKNMKSMKKNRMNRMKKDNMKRKRNRDHSCMDWLDMVCT